MSAEPTGRGTEVHDRSNGAPLSEPLLDATVAAHLLGVRPSWIYEAVRAGRIPHLKVGRHIRFLRSDLEGWVLSKRVTARIPAPAARVESS